MKKYSGIVPAILLGCAAAIIPTLLQPHFKAGSFPDFVCELFLLPGKLIASLIGAQFPVRGTASPEFLWWSRLATVIAFAALTYAVLRYRKSSHGAVKTFLVGLSFFLVLIAVTAGSLVFLTYRDCTALPARLFHRFFRGNDDFVARNTRFTVLMMGTALTPEGHITDFTKFRASDCVEVTVETESMSSPAETEREMEKMVRGASRVVERGTNIDIPEHPNGDRAVLLFGNDARAKIVLWFRGDTWLEVIESTSLAHALACERLIQRGYRIDPQGYIVASGQ